MSLLFFEQIIESIKNKNIDWEDLKSLSQMIIFDLNAWERFAEQKKRRKTISYIVGVVECFLTDEMITMMGDGKPH